MSLNLLVINAALGATIAVAIAIVSRSAFGFLSGLLPLFPTFALYAHVQAMRVGGAQAVKLVAAFGLMSLFAYAVYLLALLVLIDRFGFRTAVLGAIGLWTAAALVIITLWRVLNLEGLIVSA